MRNVAVRKRSLKGTYCERMGGVVGQLACLLCCSGCDPSLVASKLAFHPPKSSYTVQAANTESSPIRTPIGPLSPYLLQLIGSPRTLNYEVSCQRYKEDVVQVCIVDMLTTRQGTKIPIVYLGCAPTNGARQLTLLCAHGNATDIGGMMGFYFFLVSTLKVNVVAFEYSGYGCSTGEPTEKQLYSDAEAAFDWCVSTLTTLGRRFYLSQHDYAHRKCVTCHRRAINSARQGPGLIRPKRREWSKCLFGINKGCGWTCPALAHHQWPASADGVTFVGLL